MIDSYIFTFWSQIPSEMHILFNRLIHNEVIYVVTLFLLI